MKHQPQLSMEAYSKLPLHLGHLKCLFQFNLSVCLVQYQFQIVVLSPVKERLLYQLAFHLMYVQSVFICNILTVNYLCVVLQQQCVLQCCSLLVNWSVYFFNYALVNQNILDWQHQQPARINTLFIFLVGKETYPYFTKIN